MTIKTRTMSGPIEIKAVFTAEEVVHAAQALMNVNLRLRVATQAHVVAAARNVIADVAGPHADRFVAYPDAQLS